MGSYDPSIYFEIFGAEYGWILYREIKLSIHEDKRRKFTYKYGTGERSFDSRRSSAKTTTPQPFALLRDFSWSRTARSKPSMRS